MGNNMMNQNMFFSKMYNNMMNPEYIENMMNQWREISEKDPVMAYSMMRQINPIILNKMNELTNERKMKNNNDSFTNNEEPIPEYERIDIESNPLNKYIENAINISYTMKLDIQKQKISNPNLFINITETLSHPGLLSNKQPSNADYKYLLCLIGKILENNNVTVGIYKNYNEKDRVELSTVQFIFSGLINKKKYKLKFSNEINENYFLCIRHDLSYRKTFIEDKKTKISQLLNIDKKLLILTNPRMENNLYLDLAFNPEVGILDDNFIKQALIRGEIIDCQTMPLLEGCKLSPSIFDPQYHKFYGPSINFFNLRRGGEEYIQPISWTAYGFDVSGKYDFGNDNWLGNNNEEGEFAVAYYGINKVNHNYFSSEIFL
jgi:hypothetical protein